MRKVAKGDHAAFRQLVEKHQAAVVGTIGRMLSGSSDIDDLAQTVFIRVWRNAPNYQPKAKFTTWLFTIVRNLVYNETKKQTRIRKQVFSLNSSVVEFDPPDEGLGPEAQLKQVELQRMVDQAVAALPERQRLAIILRRYEGLTYEEIAEVMELSLAAVKSQIFRARTTLKEKLKPLL